MGRGQIVTIIAGLIMLAGILELARRRLLRGEHALPWLLGSVAIITLGMAPRLLWVASDLLGVQYAPIVAPVAITFLLMMVVLNQGMTISELSRRNQDLAQQVSILGWQIERVQRELIQQGLAQGTQLQWYEPVRAESKSQLGSTGSEKGSFDQ
jgi:hypothetical protein